LQSKKRRKKMATAQLARLPDVQTQYSKSVIYNQQVDKKSIVCESIVHAITVALIIIAALAVVGIVPAVVAGGVMIAAGCVLLIANFIKGCLVNRELEGKENDKARRAQIVSVVIRGIINALAITMGALAITGTLPLGTIGIVVAASVGGAWILSLFLDYCCKGNETARAITEKWENWRSKKGLVLVEDDYGKEPGDDATGKKT
jgi:hypothetical protein